MLYAIAMGQIISAVHNITIHEFTLHLARETGDNFALMSAHHN